MKILNLGSLNIDKTYSVKRFVQPKETIQALDYEEFCGGKGLNQSVALARAGAEVYHAGAVGGDGKLLLDMLKEAGADTGYVETLDGASGQVAGQGATHLAGADEGDAGGHGYSEQWPQQQ